MIRKITLTLGILVVLASLIWSFLWVALPIGINDGEWGRITRTGAPSGGITDFAWSDWQTNGTEKIVIFYGFATNVPPNNPVLAFRFGKAEDQFLSFGFYQAKINAEDGNVVVVPAYGPNSWTRMKWHLPLLSLSLGVALIGFGIMYRRNRRIRGGR